MIKFIASGTLGTQQFSRTVTPVYSSLSIDKRIQDYHTVTAISGELTFYNKGAVRDYDFIKDCEANSISAKITIEIYVDDELNETGFFYPYQCDYNDDRCTASVGLNISDEYTCLNNFMGKDFNILDEVDAWGDYLITPVTQLFTYTVEEKMYVDVMQAPTWTPYVSYAGVPYSLNPYQQPSTFGFYSSDSVIAKAALPGMVTINGGCPYCVAAPLNTTDHYNVLYASRFIKSEYDYISAAASYQRIDNNGNVFTVDVWHMNVKTTWAWEYTITENDKTTLLQILPTTGDGWIDYKQYYFHGILCTLWVRIPYYADQTYVYRNTFKSQNKFIYELINPYTNSVDTAIIWRGRGLTDAIKMFLTKSGCGLTLKSEFLLSDVNPVTGVNNHLQFLQLNNCSDIKDPQSSEPATILNMNFGELLDALKNLFNCYWFVDGEYFRIEHLSYFENGYSYTTNNQPTYDLTTNVDRSTGKPELISSDRYSYNVENICNSEKWTNVSPVYYDFQNLQIYYDIQSENEEKVYATSFITDLGGVMNFPSEYANSGCVIVAIEQVVVDLVSGEKKWLAVNEVGVRSGFMVTNGHLCPANLFVNYWQNGRVLESGEFMNETKLYASVINKRTQTVTVRDCTDTVQVPNIVKTGLGSGTVVATKYDLIKKVKTLDIEI